MIEPYWLTDDDAPFATMLQVIDTYCNPDAGGALWDELAELARQPEPPARIARFKAELRSALEGRKTGLPPKAVFTAAMYDDGDEDVFLRRLWSELYPDEPVPEPATN